MTHVSEGGREREGRPVGGPTAAVQASELIKSFITLIIFPASLPPFRVDPHHRCNSRDVFVLYVLP